MPPSERRAAIIRDVLPTLVERGVTVTTRQLASAAGVSEGTLFNVFADKEAGVKPSSTVHVMELPHAGEHVTPLVYTIPLQLLAYHVATRKGTDVDQPRNLAKSVTVE